jgi:drug/metabolite transporter (DMT)-like permease
MTAAQVLDPAVEKHRVAHRARIIGVVAVAVAVVGLSFGSTIVKSSGSPGPVVAFWRLFIGSILWWAFLALTRTKFSARDLRSTAPLGVLFGVNLCLFFTAARMTRVAHVEFISTLTPVILVPIAARRFREKVSPVVLVCGSVALCGVAFILLTSAKGSTNWTGNAFAVAAVLLWASYLIHSKSVRAHLDTKRFMAGMTVIAMLVALPFAVSTHRMFDVSAKGWVLIGTMAISSGVVCHGIYAWSQKLVPLATIGLMQLGQPGLSTMWAGVFLHESVRPIQVVGMAVVLAAVAVIAVRTATATATPRASSTDGA